jgi:AraC-like DNA-binding protein
MLIDTNLPISKIAYELGFSSIEHISRFFSKEKGISPSGFRNKYRKA